MVHLNVIEARLSKLGIRCGWLSRPELIELQHILMDDEEIVSLVNGRYFAGFATLVATDLRLLIIDKRPFFMTYEDIRYDMVSQLDYTVRLLDATLHIFTVNKQHRFTSFVHRHHLHTLTKYVQQRVMELRQIQQLTSSATPSVEPTPVSQPPTPQHTVVRPIPTPRPHKNYRQMASRLSGRVLGPVAVKAAQYHWINIHNPYTKASLMVRHSNSVFRPYAQPTENPMIAVQPEL